MGRLVAALAGLGLAACPPGAPSSAAASPAPANPPALRTTVNLTDGATFVEWWSILANPANVTWDEVGSGVACPSDDRDCSAAMAPHQDLRRLAWTSNSTNVYFYLERQATLAETATYLIYLDENGDGLIRTNDRVLRLDWQPTRTLRVQLLRYQAASPAGDPMTAAGQSDGHVPAGVIGLGFPDSGAPPDCVNCGSVDGRAAEFGVPWTVFTTLSGPRSFGYHVSSLTSVTGLSQVGPSQVRDNLGGATLTHGVRVEPLQAAVAVAPGAVAEIGFRLHQLGNRVALAVSGERLELRATSALGLPVALHGAGGERLGLDANGDGDFTDADDVVDVDGSGSGGPDTGTPVAVGGSVDVFLRVSVPADAAGLVDVVELLAAPEFLPAAVERGRVALHAGPVTLETDGEAAGVPSRVAHHALAVTNHGAVAQRVDFEIQSGYAAVLHADAGGGLLGPPLADSDGDGRPDVLLAAGERRPLVLVVQVPGSATPGEDIDVAVVRAVPADEPEAVASARRRTRALAALTLRHVHDVDSPRGPFRAAPGFVAWLPHEVVNATEKAADVFLNAAVLQGNLSVPAYFGDPNRDGNPDDGLRLSGLAPLALPPFGGRQSFLVAASVSPAETVGSALALRVEVVSPEGDQDRLDHAGRAVRGMAMRSSTFEVQAPAYGPCDLATVTFGRAGAGAITFDWQGPGGPVRSQARTLDHHETARDGRRFAAADLAGDWRVQAAGDEAPWRLERAASLAAAAVATAPGTAGWLAVRQAVGNAQEVAAIVGAAVEWTVLSAGATPGVAGGMVLVSDGLSARLIPYDGGRVTSRRTLPRLLAGEDFEVGFGLRGVDWAEGGSFAVHARLLDGCGGLLASATATFDVEDEGPPPDGIDILRNADATARDLEQVHSLLRNGMTPALDPVRDLLAADVGALPEWRVAGDGAPVGEGQPGVMVFYELVGSVGPLRVRRDGADIVLDGW